MQQIEKAHSDPKYASLQEPLLVSDSSRNQATEVYTTNNDESLLNHEKSVMDCENALEDMLD